MIRPIDIAVYFRNSAANSIFNASPFLSALNSSSRIFLFPKTLPPYAGLFPPSFVPRRPLCESPDSLFPPPRLPPISPENSPHRISNLGGFHSRASRRHDLLRAASHPSIRQTHVFLPQCPAGYPTHPASSKAAADHRHPKNPLLTIPSTHHMVNRPCVSQPHLPCHNEIMREF